MQSKHGFLFCGNYILKYWWVIKACYNNGQKERLCLIIDKCRRQKLCKRAHKISAAAPLRVRMFTSAVVSIVVRNTIFRKAPPSVVFGYDKRSINLNKVVATFEKHNHYTTDTDRFVDIGEIVEHHFSNFLLVRLHICKEMLNLRK
jgi:hypothetical protein